MLKSTIRPLAFTILMIILLMAARPTAAANGDFSLQLVMDGDDITKLETIVIDPQREMTIDLHIFDVTRDVTLQKLSIAVTFAGQTIHTLSQSLGDFHLATGEDFRKQVVVSTKEVLMPGDRSLVTGAYLAVITLEYTSDAQPEAWSEAKNIRISGNPLNTPAGAAGVVIGGGTFAAILMLIRSLAAPGLPAGAALPVSTQIRPSPRLSRLVSERLEPTTRGRVMGSIAKAVKGRIIKDRCPICRTHLRSGYCYTCKKSAREVRKEYADRVRTLVLQSSELLASGQAATLDELCSRLGIDAKLGTDVIATLKHAKLVKVKGIVGKLMDKAVMVGIGSGLSAIVWITLGGLAVLSSSALVAILVASVVIPIAVTKGFQMKTKSTVKKHTKQKGQTQEV